MNKEKIFITDVSPRDGLQNQNQYVSTTDKYLLIQKLVNAGLKHIEVSSFVSPKAVPMLADAMELVPKVLQDFPEVDASVLIPNIKGVERAITTGVKEVALVLCATETMNQKNINMSLDKAISSSKEIIALAKENKLRTKAYIGVAFDCPYEGRVSKETVLKLAREMYDEGVDQIVVADTIGSASPFLVRERLAEVLQFIPQHQTVIHLHNTRGMALANAWAALDMGVRWFDASVGGIGGCPFAPGAAGNMATEDLVLMAEQCGYSTGISLQKLVDAVQHAENILNRNLGGGSLNWIKQNITSLDTFF